MTMLDAFVDAQWRKSTHSSQGVDCVEVASLPRVIAVSGSSGWGQHVKCQIRGRAAPARHKDKD